MQIRSSLTVLGRRAAVTAIFASLALTQSSCALLSEVFQKPTVTLKDVKLTSISFDGISANFILGVQNPNAIGLNLASLGYQINVDGHQFAAGQANQAFAVPAQGSGQIVLPIGIKFADFIASIESLLSKQNLPYSLATNLGFASPIGTIAIPLSHQGTFPVPRLPDVSFSGVTVGNIDLTGATINLGLNMKNPNNFELPLGNLAYAVKINGSPLLQNVTSPTKLAAGQTQSIPIAARVDFVKAGLGIMNAITSRNATVALDGNLDLGGMYKKPLHLEQRLR